MSDESSPKDPNPGTAVARGSDVALVHGVTDDGQGLHVIRRRRDVLEAGVVRPLREGKAIQGEVVSLRPRKECPLLCDVDVELPAPSDRADTGAVRMGDHTTSSGPAQVATERYRSNWDIIFGARTRKDELAN